MQSELFGQSLGNVTRIPVVLYGAGKVKLDLVDGRNWAICDAVKGGSAVAEELAFQKPGVG